jgi:Flp pilus assembly protein CpaB
MTYRLRNIVIAVALAVLAAMMTSFYVKQQKDSLEKGQTPTTVWVAKSDIPAGTSGEDVAGMLTSTVVAKKDAAPGAIVKPDDLSGQVSMEQIYQGEQVSLLRFAAPEEQGVRAKLSGNLRAIQIPGDSNQLLLGTVASGDKVDVVGAWKLQGGDTDQKVSRVVLRDLLVLQAPEPVGDNKRLSSSAGSDKAIMLAVTDAQAQKLFWIFANGEWTLSLRPTKDPADSPQGLEWSGTVLADGLTRDQLHRLLFDPFKAERTTAP